MFGAPIGGLDITADGCIGPRSTAFYELRAKGGAAAVTISELFVHPETDRSPLFHLDLAIPGSLESFAYTADAIRRHGAVPSVEFSHGGRYAALAEVGVKYGPSPGIEKNGSEVKELTKERIQEIVQAYGRAAALSKRAGFEMIMVHGGHGWLINQFFSPAINFRKDEYGGSIENRCRFALEVLDSVRAAVGPGFPIEFRMSGRESVEGGYGLDTAVEIASIIENKVDLLHVSAGSHHNGFGVTHPSMFSPHGVNVYLAAEIKKHVKIPVATVGALNDPALMEEILASGKADVIVMGRALIADPYLPRKIMENRDDEILQCTRCYTCFTERGKTSTRRCALNPLIGHEMEGLELLPAPKARKVLVAGGGPGGMEAALTAAQRGHKVILCEKADKLGGILNCERDIPFKQGMYRYTGTMERLLKKEGVEIRLNTPVTKAYAENEKPDVLICAVGSEPIIPPLPGINSKNVIVINDLSDYTGEIGKRVIVLGGGPAGCEAAILFGGEGKDVTLVEMCDSLPLDANSFVNSVLLEKLYASAKIRLGYTGRRITEAGLTCTDSSGKEILLDADTIICAVGQRSCRAAAEELLDSAPRVYQIGDCVKPLDMTAAIYQGYHAALDI
jgi:2,4-dienoyl-CoA reductase-like NADH-dependent reductase (Old Yellow Enzyme family)/thioredoxin reductase